ncbi:hypothetical protein ACQW02_05175 [Humitalea sp. 24SJ18S-53]|uniref:hypothetical protein n=1 Tax=Humitalea sp. 24SJ18S-53 TaxID=3422307 RepID=UPI003D66DDB5
MVIEQRDGLVAVDLESAALLAVIVEGYALVNAEKLRGDGAVRVMVMAAQLYSAIEDGAGSARCLRQSAELQRKLNEAFEADRKKKSWW